MNIKRYIDMRVRQILHFDGVINQYFLVLKNLDQKLNVIPKINANLDRALNRCHEQVKTALNGFSAIMDPSVAPRILPRNPRVVGGDVVVWSDPMKRIWGKIMTNLSLGIKIMKDWEKDFMIRGLRSVYDDVTITLRDVLISMQKVKPANTPEPKPLDWLPEKWVNQWKNSH